MSVVVVTFRRPGNLRNVLFDLVQQTWQPSEIVVVDNGGYQAEAETSAVCAQFSFQACIRRIECNRNSLPAARNRGVAECRTDFVALVDDDVRIGSDYLEVILRTFEKYQDAVGVQGYINPGSRGRFRERVHRLFGLYHLEPGACRVLPSISTTYPSSLERAIRCEWLSGTNQVYRRPVVEEVQWDEQLLKYADGEDLDHSYRVHQRYPNCLYITPEAKVHHDESSHARVSGYELIAMREIYGWYLLNKLFPHSHAARAAYVWSRLGRLGVALVVALTARRPGAWRELMFLIRSYGEVIARRRSYAAGDLTSFNTQLTQGRVP